VPPIQIRNVPDDVHAKLKAKAKAHGQSLSEFALAELRLAADRLTLEEAIAQTEADEPVEGDFDTVAIIRELRGPI